MKKLCSMLLSAIMLLGMCVMPVGAEENISVTLNGRVLRFDQPPIMVNDRTLVPMRAIFEALGATVKWNDSSQTVTAVKGNIVLKLKIGEKQISKNGKKIKLDVASVLLNDRTLVPIRAISESVGANVEWDEDTNTVIITYDNGNTSNSVDKNDGYDDKNTTQDDKLNIDDRELSDNEVSIEESDVYKDENKNEEDSNSSDFKVPLGVLSDYVNGAFMYINVPAGTSIEIPNTSDGSFSIGIEGVYNYMKMEKNGNIVTNKYNTKDKKGTCKLYKLEKAVIENSGSSDMIVSIPAEYAKYSETSQKVYECLKLNSGESAELNGMYKDYVYVSSLEFEYIVFDSKKESLSKSDIRGQRELYVSKTETSILTAKEPLEVYYCPVTAKCEKTSQSAFKDIKVGSGETVRIYASDNSMTKVYTTNSDFKYDYVVYNNEKVSSQKQNQIGSYISVGKKRYVDFTNKADVTVTIKIPTVYCSVS